MLSEKQFMLDHLRRFFKERYNQEKPILLAFSGGPDSLALLHLLIEFSAVYPLKLALAHVDHGWREESGAEALEIALLAKKLGLTLHLKKIQPDLLTGNLEAACRNERLEFFALLCQEYGYQAVLLAHHADDVAETVLKRVLEGASLPNLALRPEVFLYGMKVWRPLLAVSKAAILDWLQTRNLQGFVDKSNLDLRFLRARFRLQVLPYLSETFGKNISSSLCQISDEAQELDDYLAHQTRSYMNAIVKGTWGYFLDLSLHSPKALFEMKYVVRQFCKRGFLELSRECLNQAVQFMMQKTANKSFIKGKGESVQRLYIDRGRLFMPLVELLAVPGGSIGIEESRVATFGQWEVEMIGGEETEDRYSSDWKSIWLFGKGEVFLPRGNYQLAAPGNDLSKWWGDHKIPAFFREKVPIILENGGFRHEFLTGKKREPKESFPTDLMKLSIVRKKS